MAEASLQTVMHRGLDRYRGTHQLSPRQWQVCHHILDCRTEALGGLGLDSDHCGQRVPHYYACRDRHCPRCQRRASRAWCERQQAAVLPVTYHHLVVTLPHDLNPWVQLHPEVIYALLFKTVCATLSRFGADPKRLGGELGMTAVLHTWGQTLSQHVHLHCLIPRMCLLTPGPMASGQEYLPVSGAGHSRAMSAAASSADCANRFRTASFRALGSGADRRAARHLPTGWCTPSPVLPTPRPWWITWLATATASL